MLRAVANRQRSLPDPALEAVKTWRYLRLSMIALVIGLAASVLYEHAQVAGVGQRRMTGVAKRMAGQFFKAIDDELTGAVVPIAAAPSAEARGAEAAVPAAEAPRVFTGKAAASAGVGPDVQTLLLGVGIGGLLTALGVALGYLLGRRR